MLNIHKMRFKLPNWCMKCLLNASLDLVAVPGSHIKIWLPWKVYLHLQGYYILTCPPGCLSCLYPMATLGHHSCLGVSGVWCCASSIGLHGGEVYTNLGDRPELGGKKFRVLVDSVWGSQVIVHVPGMATGIYINFRLLQRDN